MPRDRDALYDILDAARLIVEYTDNLEYESFRGDQRTADAVIRRFEIIGEATKRLSPEFRDKHKTVPWEDMAGMRDRVIHGYDTVDWQLVWKASRESIFELIASLDELLGEFEEDSQ
jgi:uncharacterized protein with HEPN domain